MRKINKTRAGLMIGILLLPVATKLAAEEGMWIPLLIEKYHIESLREAGLRLSAEDIYSINQDCLKDAIVIFGRGCTGEMISEEGLVLTNHHCGERAVQSHTSVERDYLSHGFWATRMEEELPNENLSVSFLRYIRDVTDEVTGGLRQGLDPQVRERLVNVNMGEVVQAATSGTHFNAVVKPFYYGNAFYLFVYEVFNDVRLVGAPPVSIGNFGGDQDNWMWPRHTGDFTLFRVYADEQNQPAGFSPSNRPYKPRKYLEIAAGGIEKGDFTMILGYPGSTTRYLYSEGVRLIVEQSLPLKIRLRTTRMEVMDRYMRASPEVRIQYATKYRGLSNAWKKWQGMILGLDRIHAIERKQEEEQRFQEWVEMSGERQLKYDGLLDQFSHLYADVLQYTVAIDLMEEAIRPVELFRQVMQLERLMKQGADPQILHNQVEGFYKDFHLPVDREIFAAMMSAYHEQMPESLLPEFFSEVYRKFKGDFQQFAQKTYQQTLFSDQGEVIRLLELYETDAEKALDQLLDDPIAKYYAGFREIYRIGVYPVSYQLQNELEKTYKSYMAAKLEMSDDKRLYPDANFTLRLTYGFIGGYQPWDGIHYQHNTTLDGIMEKVIEGGEEYAVPAKLVELYEQKDYGRYGTNGTVPVCFIASNHTSGGNSGSPILNADGRLIGINFDRNWEGTMSDVYYDPSLCRNIAVDIRYVLFIIDKFAGAGYLLDEMEIVW